MNMSAVKKANVKKMDEVQLVAYRGNLREQLVASTEPDTTHAIMQEYKRVTKELQFRGN